MNKPTQEQIKEFWEWCGLYKDLATDGERHWFKDEEIVSPVDNNGDPTIDLNNLFEWAVPKLEQQKFRMMITYNNIRRPNREYMYRVSFCKFKTNSWGKAYDEDPALALFWAIWKVIKGQK